jgi:hypothetical protein
VAIHAHSERTAVFVTEPSTNCRDIHAGLDASRRKEMSEIVVLEIRIRKTVETRVEALLGIVNKSN